MGLTTELRSWGCDEGSAHSQWVKSPVSLVQGDPSRGRGCVSPLAAFRPGLEQKAGPSLETCLHKLWTPPPAGDPLDGVCSLLQVAPDGPRPPVSLTPPAWLLESATPVLPSVEASRVELALLAHSASPLETFMERLLCTGCAHRGPVWHGCLKEHI